ncbi:hypothetical protein E2P81_ATG03191 [Venturia nashicola]|uniref:Putative 5'-nucleotidase C-terminal domain-containing protein n=1 Tax=Venturia nashicola TaxID=86259 RepID=A0A4Z1PEF8_9PEZI|nr:hypothetical protein E6O75_ATG03262 [Venturia nashicola]TLD36302.1 hypothetical protein E2P81_ATG03191 [Venturia nashicola]
MRLIQAASSLALFVGGALACGDCSAPQNEVIQTRLVRRMQPDAQNATSGPKAPLEWGQVNFLQTTDTHGWLEGHIKEKNYGADWGDFVSFTSHMKQKAKSLGVDLLLIDTGDLHDGAGISDATSPNGLVSNPIFENIDYDLLTIGNHELYITDIAYETFGQFAKVYGDRYVTSNVKILNRDTGKFEYVGVPYRYFTTPQGLRVMAFGVLFNFAGNSNVSQVTTAATMVTQQWFLDAVNYTKPIDMFIVAGHNPIRTNVSTSTFGTIYKAIRNIKPATPIQFFGGHTHIRDFFVYDNISTGLESGRYCESLGWLSINGISGPNYPSEIEGVPTATRNAVVVATGSSAANLSLSTSTQKLTYSRRYLDWNRRTFAYHANGSQDHTFDIQQGKAATAQISAQRQQLNLSTLYGCAPRTYCQFCKPFGDPGNIFSLLPLALSATVINQTRRETPRLIIGNTGGVRFDLVQGPFTHDDSFIVVPITNTFQFLPDVDYKIASQVIGFINAGSFIKKRDVDLSVRDFSFNPMLTVGQETCLDPPITHRHLNRRSYASGKLVRRQHVVTPGYVTTDDFGTDGDDTLHSEIPDFSQPNVFQANASFPADGSTPATVDLVFYDFIQPNVLKALKSAGASFVSSQVQAYMPKSFTTNSVLPAYAKLAWQANVPSCPVGDGVGS